MHDIDPIFFFKVAVMYCKERKLSKKEQVAIKEFAMYIDTQLNKGNKGGEGKAATS